ncbi:hypothetical protein GCM10010197_26270 [Nocardioides luteus]|uniref:Uncharacterized protein n=1 Tax=Nocardioides luteus TaxID=1844 RepID=A0ABQ5SXE1_9ACTN|nr:hypothetical protein GCM10010197_26270 [Nocardioides luteus]GLJ68649.1 hypothetical protein GCM10017579_26850 [Nocardioides luteus]
MRTQVRAAGVNSRSAAIRGSATFTTAESSTIISWATRTRAIPAPAALAAVGAGGGVGGATVDVIRELLLETEKEYSEAEEVSA